MPADRQPQAGAAILARGAGVGLLELLEHAAQRLFGDADAGVDHLEDDDRRPTTDERDGSPIRSVVAVGRRVVDAQRDRARVGELGRVREQVEQDLLDFVLIGVDRRQVGATSLASATAGRQQRLGGRRRTSDQAAALKVAGCTSMRPASILAMSRTV